ncbi:sulfite exporter TauE/SafE family protein [Priestia megaterium]|uniref:sulfite exporter TauE/SafE family protein n=1 Tax=Priestia megaterium TaxID=1404 RepID=UPI00227F75D8|nr:sulfite exporter TauE/SafE family protein [Priestia megaterium]MCY9017506.1 sulfite exporter TauE/SafE family protein [Priestia megaterium]
MKKLFIFAIIGFLAQLIDGSLGMAYGVTSSSLLLTFGMAPAIVSASIHLSEVVTTAASGISHMKFGNVDRQALFKLIIPGSIGAFIGACFLSNVPGDIVKPYISLFLLMLGIYVVIRFVFKDKKNSGKKNLNLSTKQAIPLGLIAGFADATGGGGWGPLTTPILLSKNSNSARKVIGTVDTSEFAIAISATLGFLISLGWQDVNWLWVIALMLGGIIAAPIAAWLVKIMPSFLLGVLVGGFIILTNVWTLFKVWPINNIGEIFTYIGIVTCWIVAIIFTIKNNRKNN